VELLVFLTRHLVTDHWPIHRLYRFYDLGCSLARTSLLGLLRMVSSVTVEIWIQLGWGAELVNRLFEHGDDLLSQERVITFELGSLLP